MAGSTIHSVDGHSVDGHSVDRRRADVRRAVFRQWLLAGVSLCAVLAASPEPMVGQAWARRDLIPPKPSVEVNLEVLSQLTVATAPFQMGISQAELPPHGMTAPASPSTPAPSVAVPPAASAVPLPPPPTSAGGASYQPSASTPDLPPAMAAVMPASAPKVSPPPPGRMVPVQNQIHQRETHVGRTPSVPAAAIAPVVSAPPAPVVSAQRPMPPTSAAPARPAAVAPARLSSYRRAEPAKAADEPFFFGDRNPPAVAKSAAKSPVAVAKAEPVKPLPANPQPATPEPVKVPPTTAKVLPAAAPILPPAAVESATAPLPEPKLNEMDFGSFPTLPPAAQTQPAVPAATAQPAPMMPSLNKGLDDFITKDQPAAPASALPDVSVLTGESTAAPMAEVGTALPPIDGLAAPVGAPPTLPPPPMAAPEKPVIVRAEPKVEPPRLELPKTAPKAEPLIPDIELPPLPEAKPDEAPAAKPEAKAEPKQFAPEPAPSLPALPEMNEAQVKAEAKQEAKAEPVAPPALPELPGAPDLPQFDMPDENELELASLPQPGEPLPAEDAAGEGKKDAAAELKPLPAQASGASLLKVEFATTENEVPVSGQKQLSALAAQIAASKQAIVIRSFIRDSEESSGIVGNRIATGRSFAVRSLLIDKGISHFNISIDNSVGKLKGNATEYVEILAK